MMIICLTVRRVCYSLTWSCIIGNAEGEGVRGPVSETGNQFLEGWTPSCSKSKFRNGPQRRTPGPGPVLSLKGSCIWTTWRWRLLGFFPRIRSMRQTSTRTSTRSWASSGPKQTGTWADSEISCSWHRRRWGSPRWRRWSGEDMVCLSLFGL